MMKPKDFGNIFTGARKKRSLSVEEVCRMSRMHPDVVADIESGVFDRLGKLYMKGFVKKYSSLLGLNTEDIMKKYESISSGIRDREFSLDIEKKEKNDAVKSVSSEKKARVVFVIVLSAVAAFVILGMISSKMPPGVRQGSEADLVKNPGPAASAKNNTAPPKRSAGVTLTVKARGKAWLQIREGDKTIFAGILENGDSKTWRSDGTLTGWTGKAEMLDFIVNKRNVGAIAKGVVKNIMISSAGIKIGNEWITRL